MTSNHSLPSEAKVVIVGGGVIGTSVAYHLTLLGWKDVVLLDYLLEAKGLFAVGDYNLILDGGCI